MNTEAKPAFSSTVVYLAIAWLATLGLLAYKSMGEDPKPIETPSALRSDAEREVARVRRLKCVTLRVEFFRGCIGGLNARQVCEAMWSQLGGKMFDGDPTVHMTEQIDCSK